MIIGNSFVVVFEHEVVKLRKSFSVHALRSPLIPPGGSVFNALKRALWQEKFFLRDNDILVVASKVFSMQQNRIINLDDVTPSAEAEHLAQQAHMSPRFVELVLRESNHQIYGFVTKAILTKTEFGINANAGIDMSNAPPNHALLLPKNSEQLAKELKESIAEEYNVNVGVIIIDSKTIPLRRGTSAVALAVAGLPGIIDERGSKDLYGNTMKITTRALADNIGTAAMLIIGETNECQPFAVVRGLGIKITDETHSQDLLMPEDQCLYFSPLVKLFKQVQECNETQSS